MKRNPSWSVRPDIASTGMVGNTNEATEDVGETGMAPACGWPRAALLVLLLWCSGFCGISYEVLYGRLLGNLLGDQFGVSAAVLLTFLLGIGIGTLCAHRWVRWLWAIEFGVGVCGVLSAFFTEPLGELLYRIQELRLSGIGVSLVVGGLLLAVPSFLIGVTLPVFAAWLNRATGRGMFSYAYLAYNLGAALTALLVEFWLLRWVGLKLATLLVANLNFLVAAGLFFGFTDFWRNADVFPRSKSGPPAIRRGRLLALVIASVASAVFQLTMVKVAESFLGPFRETFALVLTVSLAAIAVGAMMVRRCRVGFSAAMWMVLAGLAWMLWAQGSVLEGYAARYAAAASYPWLLMWLKLKTVGVLMAVPSVAFGATVPALLNDESEVARDSGWLLFLSSVANACGFLMLALVLHERLSYRDILLLVAGLAAVAGILAGGWRPRNLVPPIVLGVGVFMAMKNWDERLIYLGYTEYHKADKLAEARKELGRTETFKGRQDNFSITHYHGRPYLMINGYRSIMLEAWFEKGVGAITSTYSPRLDEALVLGLGAGATAAAVGLAFDHTDVVEINPVLVRNQHRFSEYNFDIGRNPQVNVIVDDGIHHVRSTAKRYSLILNTVTSPLYFSSSKLYTREFLESVRGALEPDGIYMTWLDSRVGGRGIDIMLVTLAEVFPHCRLAYVRSGYFLLIASAEPPRVWHPEAPSRSPELRDYFFVGNDLNPDWMSYAVVSPNAYKLIGDRGAPLNTLDRPELEFAMARHQYQGYSGFRVRLSRYVTAAGMEGLNTPAFTWNPAHFLAHAEDALGDGWLASAIRQAVVPSGLEGERFRSLARADFFRDRAALTDSARDHYYEGVWARRGENYDRAIEAFSKCLDRKPDFNNAWFGIALSHERSGAVDEAINAYRLELEIDPKDRDVWPRLGRLLHGKGLHIEAVDALSRALERRVNPELLLLRGLSYEALGRGEEASSDFRRVLGDGETRARALDALLRVSR